LGKNIDAVKEYNIKKNTEVLVGAVKDFGGRAKSEKSVCVCVCACGGAHRTQDKMTT
jgi:hypothetical protein